MIRGLVVRLVVAAVTLTGSSEAYCSVVASLYWTNESKIQRGSLDGTGVTDLVTGTNLAKGIVVDGSEGYMYWASLGLGMIRRANLDGTGVTDLVTGLHGVYDVALADGKVYWTATGAIQRANLDGSAVEDVVTGLEYPQYLDIDTVNSFVYWTEDRPSGGATNDAVRRTSIPPAGGAPHSASNVVVGLDNPFGIASDPVNGRVYWTEEPGGQGRIRRAYSDGANVQTLISTDYNAAYDILLDVSNDLMYWADPTLNHRIQKAKLDGSDRADVFTGIESPCGLAFGPTPTPIPAPSSAVCVTSLFAMAAIASWWRRRRKR